MKRYIFLLSSFFVWIISYAQPIMGYEFESKNGVYEEITGGTVVNSSIHGIDLNGKAYTSIDKASDITITDDGFPIGFNFLFNNQEMNRFAIGTNGYIILGQDKVTVESPADVFSSVGQSPNTNVISTAINGKIIGLNDTELSYKVSGVTPSRILIVQYKNLGFTDIWESDIIATVQFQIRLYENSNNIEIIYKDWKMTTSFPSSAKVGIKGEINDRLLIESTGSSWTEKASTTTNASATLSYTQENYPPDGLTYRFTPPGNCESPVEQPQDLILNSTSISMTGHFKKTPGTDLYLVLLSESETITELPIDGNYYKAGDKLGNATVISLDSLDTFTAENLEGNKKYYISVLAVNSFCMYGPKYNVNAPLTASTITNPSQPESLSVIETELNTMTLSIKSNPTDDKVIIAMTTEPSVINGRIEEGGLFGQPSSTLNVGEKIEGGGIIIYKGNSAERIIVNNLQISTIYHFKAWSFKDNDNYSTTSVTADDVTMGQVPYKPDFNIMPVYLVPTGWAVNKGGTFRLTTDGKNIDVHLLECNITTANTTNGTENHLTSPWIYLSEGTNRVAMNYNMSEYSRFGTSAYNTWDERDYFEIQASANGIDFETIYKVTGETAPKFAAATSYVDLYAPFDKFAGQKVKVRLLWKCYKGIKLLVKDFRIEEKKACDYPINLSADDDSLIGEQAKISWSSQGEEDTWEIRYRKAGSEEWVNPIEVRENPYLLTKLPTQTDIELQIRAKCSLTNQSDWSESLNFKTGYGVPFTEPFNGTSLPLGWELKVGELGDPTEFCDGTNCAPQWAWSSFMTVGLILSPKKAIADDWVVSPLIDLGDGSVNYIFNFNLLMMSPQENDETYSIVISTDDGKTFSSSNVLSKIEKADLPERGQQKTFSAPLKGYKGKVRIGIYVKSTTGKVSGVQMKSISITESCPSDILVNPVSELTSESAKITWESTADSWLVFSRIAGDKTKDFKVLNEKALSLNDLQPRTTYEVGITKMCEVGDTAKVAMVSFTTEAIAQCPQVEEVNVTPKQYDAFITWSGDAMAYNIKYRSKGSGEFITKQITETSLTIEGLEPEKEYGYAIQSMCSTNDGDVSEWTEEAFFKTLAVTCFQPENILAIPTYKSVTVTWEGEADKYEMAYCKGAEAWQSLTVTAHMTTIEQLEPETAYKVRVRSICSDTDMSKWSATVDFTTESIPDCVAPTNLQASGISETTVDLTWDADENHLTWDVHYREGSVTSWTTIKELAEKKCSLKDLKENTVYLWSVKATCDELRTSVWAAQDQFTTLLSGIETSNYNSLKVFTSNKILNVINPEHILIQQLQIFSMDGQLLNTYKVNTDDNILLPMGHSEKQLIVKIDGENLTHSFVVIFN